MNSYSQSAKWSLLIFFFYVVAIVLFIQFFIHDTRTIYYGDESKFIQTVYYFHYDISLETIKDYDEMSTPLPFVLYAVWAKAFGIERNVLRLLTLLFALATFLLFHRLIYDIFRNAKIAFWSTLFLFINPYMTSLSFLIYTDMFAIFFLILASYAVIKRMPFTLFLAMALALLTRQYLVFFLGAMGLFFLIRWLRSKTIDDFKMLSALTASAIPLGLLVLLWGGLTPDNELKHHYLAENMIFHTNFLVTYILIFFVYLLPLVVMNWRNYMDRKILLLSFGLSWTYWLFPVVLSKSAAEGGFPAIGLFHQSLQMILGKGTLIHSVFFLSFFFGLIIFFHILESVYQKLRKGNYDFKLLLELSILSFYAIMPLSYLVWEKYILPVIPLGITLLLLIRYQSNFKLHKELNN